ncbi:CPCC family cysteine-rich protein [Streptomyces sp. NPDC048410]|uniref:CPCC family cysteine-rich protein n=1 Tax=Streptomyces sp. NPDC048410 TaxID=3365545 RepID=UPI003722C0EE
MWNVCGLQWGLHQSGNTWCQGRPLDKTARVSRRFPCPCCGHQVFARMMPGSYEICPICFWEDDHVQFRWPTMAGGANTVSLIEAQRNYLEFGACERPMLKHVRPPAEDEPLDPAWRPIDPVRDSFEEWPPSKDRAPWPEDHSVLYWWLPTFWRRDHSAS